MEGTMALKLTQKKQEQLYDNMMERLSKGVREMFEPRTIASRLYPNLKTKPTEDDQPKRRAPVDGWAKQRKEWE
jgi:hypothetical protein